MKSLRYAVSKRTPHNFDDLEHYCRNKNVPERAVAELKMYCNHDDTPITGTEFHFSVEYTFFEDSRSFKFSRFAYSSNLPMPRVAPLKNGFKPVIFGSKPLESIDADLLRLKGLGIECSINTALNELFSAGPA